MPSPKPAELEWVPANAWLFLAAQPAALLPQQKVGRLVYDLVIALIS